MCVNPTGMQTLVIVRNIFCVKHEIILKLSIIADFHHRWENERKYRCDWTLSHDAISWYKIYKVVDFQHTPWSRYILFLQVHCDYPELYELLDLQRFSKKIRDHIISWTVLYFELYFLDAICYEKIYNVEMFGLSLAWWPTS